MEVDNEEDAAPATSTATAESRKRKAEDTPGAAGAVKFRRVEAQQDTLQDRVVSRQKITAAIVAGDADALKKLVEHDSELLEMEKPISKATPLLEAVWAGQFECVKQLLECGANANCIGAQFDDYKALCDPEYYQHFNPDGAKVYSNGPRYCPMYYPTPLIHAIAHYGSDYIQLLFKYDAYLTTQPISINEMLALAIERSDSDAIELLLGNYPNDLHFQRTGDPVLLETLRSAEPKIVRLIIEATSPEGRPQLLAQAISEISCTLDVFKLCCEYGLDLNWVGKGHEDAETTYSLLEYMLSRWNFECVDYMLQQDCDINITEISRNSFVLQSVLKPDLMMQLLQRIKNKQLHEKFINALLFELIGHIEDDLFSEFGDKEAAVKFLIDNGASPFFRWQDSDYTFHSAAAENDLVILDLFLKKYPYINFFIKGKEGKTPIGRAAENEDIGALYRLVNPCSVEKLQIITNEFRQACEEFNLIAMRNMEQLISPETRTDIMCSAFSDALKANDLERFEKLVDWHDDHRIIFLLEMTLRNGVQPYHMSASMQLCLSGKWLRNFDIRIDPLPLCSAQQRPDHILENIGWIAGKESADFRTTVFNLCQNTGLSLPIGDDILILHVALRYMQSALVSLPETPHAIQEQFGRFIVHALPGMLSRNAYLSDDYKTIQNISVQRGRILSKVLVAQLNALYIAGEQAQVKFRKSLRKDLPRICSNCIAPETGLLQRDKLERKLQRFGLFRQNALRVIDVLQLAYADLDKDHTVPSQSSNLQETNWRVQEQFKHQLTEKFTECLAAVLDPENDRVDVSLAASRAQKEFSQALRSLNEPGYMQAQGRTTIDNAFSAMVGESFFALLWWQMDQVCQAFDLRLPGEEKWQSQKLKPFLAFQKGLEKKENSSISFITF